MSKLRNTLIDLRQLCRGFELYYFYCQPLLAKGEFVECRPKFYRPACLKCLIVASKALWAHNHQKED